MLKPNKYASFCVICYVLNKEIHANMFTML